MPSRKRTPNEVGPWAIEKLDALRKYLDAYTTVMRKYPKEVHGYHYIDGFAGKSRWILKGTEDYIDGSPRVALTSKHPFHSYTFIDLDRVRVAHLRDLQQEFPQRPIHVIHEDANTALKRDVAPKIRWDDHQRAVAFLDPYAMSLEFTTLQCLAATKTIEVFVNVPTMALNRDALRTNLLATTEPALARMDALWGSADWRTVIYEEEQVRQMSLLGDSDIQYKIVPTTAKRFGDLYRARLFAAGFEHVSEPAIMRNATKQPIYCLVFAGPNKTGVKIADHILKAKGQYMNWMLD